MIVFEILRNIFLAPLELIFEIIFTLAFKMTGSEGLAIIILSLVVSTLVLPLYKRAEKIEAEQRAKEKELSHWADHIKRNFRGDLKYMTLDAYYREKHYSPLYQLRSSISILLQIPFFAAAYDLLGVRAIERFSGTGFGVLNDLGTPDGLFTAGTASINVLPILMTVINIIATFIYTKGLPKKTIIRSLALPLVFLILLYYSPSALLLYWTMNNAYSLIKTIIIKLTASGKHSNRGTAKAKPEPAGAVAKKAESFFAQGTNTGLFILSAVFMSVLTGLLIPLAYLSTSPGEFVSIMNPQNPLRYLLSSFFVAVGFFILWPGVFYYLAGKKVRIVISDLMFGISVFSVVNYLFFGTDTGTLNTSLVFDKTPEYLVSQQLINLAVVLAILIACVILYRFKKTVRYVLLAAILTMVTISFINMKKIQDTYTYVVNNIEVIEQESAPKIQLAADGKNVVVIMLDKAVSGYIPYVFNEFPEIAEKYDGFTYYPNTMSFGQNTLKTASALFGGYDYTPVNIDARPDESLAAKHDESLKVLPELFSEQGYIITLMDLPFAGWSWTEDYSAFEEIDNCYAYHVKDYFNKDTEANLNIENKRNRNLFMYSIFRCSPLFLQGPIYDEGKYLSVGVDYFDKYDVLENYIVLENLDDITVINNDYTGGLFMIDNDTTHDLTTLKDYDPYTRAPFEENFYISNGSDELLIWDEYQASSYECLVAALRELGNYMDYLRDIGVYDNTRIIIVSDHGTSVGLFEDLIFYDVNAEWYNCLLMVKDFDSTGFETDYSFMTNADVPTIALEGITDDPVNPYTGNPINYDPKSGDLYVDYTLVVDEALWNPDENQGNTFNYADDAVWLKVINQNIFDEGSWVLTAKPN